jgi:excisionase family DNA binding protein
MHGRADDSGLMTVNEVAEYFGVSASTIWRWLREGKLEGVKIGGSRRFQREDIMRIAGAEPDVVAESGPTYGGVGHYAAVTGTLMHRRMLILNQLRRRLQESRLVSKAEQKSTEDLYPATRTLAEIRRERPDSLCNGDD